MNQKMKVKISVDIGMTTALFLLMSYSMVGEAAHEWIGVGMFLLLIFHHVLNGRWSKNIWSGKYTALRVIQTALVAAVLICMLGSMISGIILSRYAFAALHVPGNLAMARIIHMLCGFWGFVMMSLHLGFHWNMMFQMAERKIGSFQTPQIWILRIAGFLIAGYGAVAFIRRQIGEYLFLKSPFVFYDFEEPLVFFLLDYMAVMGLFIWIAHYGVRAVRWMTGRKKQGAERQ